MAECKVAREKARQNPDIVDYVGTPMQEATLKGIQVWHTTLKHLGACSVKKCEPDYAGGGCFEFEWQDMDRTYTPAERRLDILIDAQPVLARGQRAA